MAKTKVSKLIRVRTGRNVVELELVEGKLAIQVGDSSKVTLNIEAVNVLRAMLGDPQFKPAKLATALPPEAPDPEHTSPDLEGESDFVEGMV
ncbi:hypothetical protein LCGC14_0665040 [marine sediment metagenome]|uniref:Uncharacterized protein n=1 Tax=marine sediment metagenome TaxID=412755 RepID=A0A0F9QSE5_9ZZZZ